VCVRDPFFWDEALCHWVLGSVPLRENVVVSFSRARSSRALRHLRMKALCFFQTSGTKHQAMHRHTIEEKILHK